MRQTRALDEDALFERATGFVGEQLVLGVTTTEAKSGYGLDLENELKQLRVLARLKNEAGFDVVPTYMGAHAVPPEFAGKPDDYVEFVCAEVLPRVAKEQLAQFCDVFCETGVFSVRQSRRVLETAKKLGLGLKIHADEIDPLGGAELAGELGAVSAEHLIATSDAGISALANGNVTACLLRLRSTSINPPPRRCDDRRRCVLSLRTLTVVPSLNIQLCQTSRT